MTKLIIAAAVLAAIWLLWRRGRRGAGMTVTEARATLDLPADADEAAIRAAHRRLIARVHPDAGGNAALAARINAARDVLLRELPKELK
ncbi:J domain-containing protein [Sphingomonas gilva]|uniref:J domain-containing protein n=1 Tax=Sphingomonas gilva TaxID=2305907 RepID=A0A396RMG2_9SPHN|nr:J domain-containing protein [Sphingomonas gilva]RHW17617.1 J domain-containing protein [Sphingomonas gilva]